MSEASEAIKFNCTKCGVCCKNLGPAIDRAKKAPKDTDIYNYLLRKFPYKAKKDGSCSKLNKNGICSVYKNRPTLCNIDRMYDDYFFALEKYPEKKDYFLEQAKSCNALMKTHDAPAELLMDLKQYQA